MSLLRLFNLTGEAQSIFWNAALRKGLPTPEPQGGSRAEGVDVILFSIMEENALQGDDEYLAWNRCNAANGPWRFREAKDP